MVLSNIYYTTIYILVHILFNLSDQILAKKSWLPSSLYNRDPSYADDSLYDGQNQHLNKLIISESTPFLKREYTKRRPSLDFNGNNGIEGEIIKAYHKFPTYFTKIL
ncbi:unnamed protein product [Lepeophtheirus salmonis]|uniref:(salmon louse) hypothetical protein n=1 Tax=Lepeophtheirus salmonis TaxID=72036 RepID=A0A7R8HCC0_LEPSM|nr:unnamed protein product [Lepeophtheirus salmonis]CAF3004181.1 unnamed protein product [Lepeophtheirus salmonis]